MTCCYFKLYRKDSSLVLTRLDIVLYFFPVLVFYSPWFSSGERIFCWDPWISNFRFPKCNSILNVYRISVDLPLCSELWLAYDAVLVWACERSDWVSVCVCVCACMYGDALAQILFPYYQLLSVDSLCCALGPCFHVCIVYLHECCLSVAMYVHESVS